jgi:hypothetical protein
VAVAEAVFSERLSSLTSVVVDLSACLGAIATVDADIAVELVAEAAAAKALLQMHMRATPPISLMNNILRGADFEPGLGCVMVSILNPLSMAFGNGNPSE